MGKSVSKRTKKEKGKQLYWGECAPTWESVRTILPLQMSKVWDYDSRMMLLRAHHLLFLLVPPFRRRQPLIQQFTFALHYEFLFPVVKKSVPGTCLRHMVGIRPAVKSCLIVKPWVDHYVTQVRYARIIIAIGQYVTRHGLSMTAFGFQFSFCSWSVSLEFVWRIQTFSYNSLRHVWRTFRIRRRPWVVVMWCKPDIRDSWLIKGYYVYGRTSQPTPWRMAHPEN